MQESLLTFPKRLAARSYYVSVAIHTPLDPRFRKPPYDPGRSDFPSPVLTLALFPPTAFHILDEA